MKLLTLVSVDPATDFCRRMVTLSVLAGVGLFSQSQSATYSLSQVVAWQQTNKPLEFESLALFWTSHLTPFLSLPIICLLWNVPLVSLSYHSQILKCLFNLKEGGEQ